MTPLKKHPGHHGGIIALSVLAVTTIVVWSAHPKRTAPPAETPKPKAAISVTQAPEPTAPEPTAPAQTVDRNVPHRVIAHGPVSFDENRTSHIISPVNGWLRKNAHGRMIRAGETVGIVYSPEVYLATTALIAQARDFRSQAALDTERLRLYRWGMRREAVTRIEQTLQPQATLPLIARVSGTVVAEKRLATAFVEAGDELLTITDPTAAWLYVEMPAEEAALARTGMTGRVTIEGIARPLSAPITYIARRVTDGTRTVRFDLHSATLRMPPTAQATVELTVGGR